MAVSSVLPLLRCSRAALGQAATFSRSAAAFSDIQIKDKLNAGKALKASEVPAPAAHLSELITVEGVPDVALTSGMPDAERVERLVRIYKPAKNAMQSGTAGIKRWLVLFYLFNETSPDGKSSLTTSRGGRII